MTHNFLKGRKLKTWQEIQPKYARHWQSEGRELQYGESQGCRDCLGRGAYGGASESQEDKPRSKCALETLKLSTGEEKYH